MIYQYYIVPSGGHKGQAFAVGGIEAGDTAAAGRCAQTTTAPAAAGKSGLEVILWTAPGKKFGVARIRVQF